MDFKYFQGPKEDMSGLLLDKAQCSICKRVDYCFELDYTITTIFNSDEREGKIGCYTCLKEGKFEFWHDTEFGVLDENGLSKVYNHNMASPPLISEVILSEMRRTPQIVTWQQELWLTHCNDFMIYKGTWEPKDFYAKSLDGDGRKLFMEMTDKHINHLWDERLEEGKAKLESWHITYYAFECKHCGKRRGNWDCD